MTYHGFVYGYEIEESDNMPRLWHYALDIATGKKYYLRHSEFSWPLREDFERRVDEIVKSISEEG